MGSHDRSHGPAPERRTTTSSWLDANTAIAVLIDNDNFLSDTRDQFALRLGWTRSHDGALDVPDVQRVKTVCALTKDLVEDGVFGGMVITYAPNRGGMLLIDPDSETADVHMIHMLVGDLQQQQAVKTTNRRRQADWKQTGQSLASAGDHDMARLFWQAEGEIGSAGFVASSTAAAIFKALAARGVIE